MIFLSHTLQFVSAPHITMHHMMKFSLLPLVVSWLAAAAPSQPQQPLTGNHQQPSLSTHRSRLIRQNDSLCDAGSSHWTGSVPVGDKRDMFFWYFESRADPETAPLIIWMNGGPGASSLLGAFHELVGPCTVNDDGQGMSRNELGWTNFANVLFIDQPVGVGFSETEDTNLWAESLVEGGVDFDHFLETFLIDFFPQLQGRPIHLAGESFGGRYCPVYASVMKRKLASVMLFDAFVDEHWGALGAYRHLCSSMTRSNPLNSTACAEMEAAYPACHKFGQLCSSTYDADICRETSQKCAAIWEPFYREVVPGGRNPYDDRAKCTTPPMCGHLGMEQVEKYMNSETLQKALGFERAINYSVVNMDLNKKWETHPDMVIPSTRELSNILDDKTTPILVVNGNNDVIVSTEGNILAFDNLVWSGQARFQTQRLTPWYFLGEDGTKSRGGEVKSFSRLAFATVDDAGHMAPRDQPHGVTQLVKAWLAGSLDTIVDVGDDRS